MRISSTLVTLTLSGVLLACATKPPPPALPPEVQTVADAKAIGDVLQSINTYESAIARADVSPRLLAADAMGMRGVNHVERWLVDVGGSRVEYEVQLNTMVRGGIDYRITRLTPIGRAPAAGRLTDLPVR